MVAKLAGRGQTTVKGKKIDAGSPALPTEGEDFAAILIEQLAGMADALSACLDQIAAEQELRSNRIDCSLRRGRWRR